MMALWRAIRALAVPLLVLAAWVAGRRRKALETRAMKAEAYIKARRAIDEADDLDLKPDAARSWLRQYVARKR